MTNSKPLEHFKRVIIQLIIVNENRLARGIPVHWAIYTIHRVRRIHLRHRGGIVESCVRFLFSSQKKVN